MIKSSNKRVRAAKKASKTMVKNNIKRSTQSYKTTKKSK